jgi:cytochrome c oxidase assembly factor CtaG
MAYAVGGWQLYQRGGELSARRVAASAGGFLSLVVALSNPVDRLAHASFAAHMTQHLLLIVAAAPLLLLADPFAALCWALPDALRLHAGQRLRRGALLRGVWRALTAASLAWLTHVAAIWLWHLPGAYDAAAAHRLVHDVEHLVFFGTALMFWWPIINPAPRLRAPTRDGLRVVYLVLAASQGALLGLLLAMSREAWYRTYPNAGDQSLGGLIMFGVGGAVDMLAVLVLVGRYLARQDQTSPGARVDGDGESRQIAARCVSGKNA